MTKLYDAVQDVHEFFNDLIDVPTMANEVNRLNGKNGLTES